MNGALLSSCYIVSLLCLLFQMLWYVWCVWERGVPLYLYRARGDAWSYIWREACTPLPLHVEEAPTHEGVAEQCRQGATAPREQPVPDRASSPPPSCGRPWVGQGLLPQGALPIFSWFGRRLPYSFVQISIGKCLSVKSFMYLCLWPAK
jgi:hypothetical protein